MLLALQTSTIVFLGVSAISIASITTGGAFSITFSLVGLWSILEALNSPCQHLLYPSS